MRKTGTGQKTLAAAKYLKANPDADNNELRAAIGCTVTVVNAAREMTGIRAPGARLKEQNAERLERVRNDAIAYVKQNPKATIPAIREKFGLSIVYARKIKNEAQTGMRKSSKPGPKKHAIDFDVKDTGPQHDPRRFAVLRLPMNRIAEAFAA